MNSEEDKVKQMYLAGINALAHIDCECTSIIPTDCDCDTRQRYVEAIELLNRTLKELTK